MKRFKWKLWFLLFVFGVTFILGGCASQTSYISQCLDISKNHPLMVSQSNEKFKITALPIITKEDGKKTFNREDLNKMGFVPIYLTIFNFGSNNLSIKSIAIVDRKGNVSQQLSASEAAEESFKKSILGSAVGGLILGGSLGAIASVTYSAVSLIDVQSVDIQKRDQRIEFQVIINEQLSESIEEESFKKRTLNRAVGGLIIAGGIGAIVSAVHTAFVNKKILNDLTERQFKMHPIPARDMRTGYAYFKIPKKTKSLDGFKLLIELESGGDYMRAELPLKGKITGK